ncbi:MAG: LysM peptidoglycan-binding domain-containing protein, partial [Propionibacteriaceae bacterium]|nr:LysM peptidoglycan-binding domain-containing protein [Propionibacteriaceae bacterium]
MNAAVSWIRRVAALVAVIALVVAVPAALVAWGRLGSLTQLDWRVLWTSSDGGALLLAGLTVIGWWAWLCVVSCLVGELAAHASCGRVHIRVPSTGWFRPVAAVLMVAILGAGITAATPREALAAPAPAAPAPAAQAAPAQPSSVVQPSADAVAPRTPTVNHVVKSGDDLWSLAQQYLGDGSQWRQIVAANATLLDPASDLPVGAVLAIPVPDAPIPVAPPPVMPDQAPGTNQTMVVVRAGDSLWSLAQQYLGDGGRWPALFEANRTVVSDPGVIRPGWELRLPGGTDAAP